MKFFFILAITLLGAAPLQAQYQDGLDIFFAKKGIASYGTGKTEDDWNMIGGAMQADGKIVGLLGQKVYWSWDMLIRISLPIKYYCCG